MSTTIRTFIAIEIDKNISDVIRQTQERLKAAKANVKWSDPENTHLTLKFLGEVEEDLIEQTGKILSEIATDFRPFQIGLDTVGAFPNIDRPRVIWLGLKEGRENLIRLNERIEDGVARMGIPKEKRSYHPHITLGRVKLFKNIKALTQAIKDEPGQIDKEWKAEETTLFKSVLTPKGPIYTKLHTARFIFK